MRKIFVLVAAQESPEEWLEVARVLLQLRTRHRTGEKVRSLHLFSKANA